MINKMTKYDFILLSEDKDLFLDNLRSLGVVDISRSVKPVDAHSEALLAGITAKKELIRSIKNVSDSTLLQLKAEKAALDKKVGELTPWGEYDSLKLESLGLDINYYSVISKKYDPLWESGYAIQKVSESDSKTYFVIVGDNTGFELKPLEKPSESLSEAVKAASDKQNEITAHTDRLASRAGEIPALEKELADMESDFSLYLASLEGASAAEDTIVVFEAFAPTEEDDRIAAELEKMSGIYWSREEASVDDCPPIKLKNNKFVSMFEVLTDMYGRPAYNGFDPTPYISIFFLLFFAMCMGDAGYGMLLAVIGLLLKKVPSFSKLAPLVVTLGLGTVVVGFFFHTFFSIDISQWAVIKNAGLDRIMVPSQIAGFDGTMVLAIIVGIVHLILAMIVKTVYATRNKGFLNSLSTWGWTLFWTGLVVIALGAVLNVIDSALTKTIIIVLGCICAVGIFPLNNMHRNPLVNVGSGLWDTYNMATGILGDVLSYLRLYALGLAGSMLGFAFNDLAKMTLGDGGVGGWIAFILIAVVGHALNLAMAALGAFVHPLRLNFLEFFKNSDYEGVGKKYNPLKK